MTDRERFCAMLFNAPLRRADAIVVLCGEDAEPRAEVALQLFKQGAAPIILCSGGRDDGDRYWGAERVQGWLMGHGLAPDRILTESSSANTYEQAAAIAAWEPAWSALTLVASAYHLPRAVLTLIRRLGLQDRDERVRVTGVPATPPWSTPPAGHTASRLALLAEEYAKIVRYRALGHVASYADGIAYLTYWEHHGQTTQAA